jgi:molybdate transport system substrate-binding protein
MKCFYKVILIIFIFVIVLLSFGCKRDEKAVTLTISAAASLRDSMSEIRQVYLKERSDVTLVYNFGGSGPLQHQIEQGADVDIFISAAQKQMNVLQDKHFLVEDTRVNLLQNSVVLIVPKNVSGIADFRDLTGKHVKKIALGESKSVPVGQYAQEVLIKLNIFEIIKSKVVYGNDTKQVLTWVETGNADAGIVYETDAKASEKVKIAAFAPENSHQPVIYPAAIIETSKNIAGAKEFLKFLTSSSGKAVFQKYGFKEVQN